MAPLIAVDKYEQSKIVFFINHLSIQQPLITMGYHDTHVRMYMYAYKRTQYEYPILPYVRFPFLEPSPCGSEKIRRKNVHNQPTNQLDPDPIGSDLRAKNDALRSTTRTAGLWPCQKNPKKKERKKERKSGASGSYQVVVVDLQSSQQPRISCSFCVRPESYYL